mgnify:CR=1 FL=1
MKKLFILLLFLSTSCGFQPIYLEKSDDNFFFKNIELIGNKRINRKILSSINFKEDKSNQTLNDITLNTSKAIKETSKNSKGQITSYRMVIQSHLKIKNNDEVVKEKIFISDYSYSNMKNKFDLSKYQDDVEKNLTKRIIEEILIYLRL